MTGLPTPSLVLITCTKDKNDGPCTAAELYMASDYFRAMRTYAESRRCPWFILSAEHGLLNPERPGLMRYERELSKQTPEYRREWTTRVLRAFDDERLPAGRVHIFGSKSYRDGVVDGLRERGWNVDQPLAHTPGLGPQKRLLRQAAHAQASMPNASDPSWQADAFAELDWTGSFPVADLLHGRRQLPPISRGIYLITRDQWDKQPTIASKPLYVGGNTSDAARFRTRVGDLLIDLIGYYSSTAEAKKHGLESRGHHSGGQTLHQWCKANSVEPVTLHIGWATRPAWCGRCEEIAVYDLWRPQRALECNRKPPTACATHQRRSSLAQAVPMDRGTPQPPGKPRAPARAPRNSTGRVNPRQLTRDSVLAALRRIDDELASGTLPAGFGANNPSRYRLIHEGREYPPKLVAAYGLQFLGVAATTKNLSGGDHVNRPLTALGFTIRAG